MKKEESMENLLQALKFAVLVIDVEKGDVLYENGGWKNLEQQDVFSAGYVLRMCAHMRREEDYRCVLEIPVTGEPRLRGQGEEASLAEPTFQAEPMFPTEPISRPDLTRRMELTVSRISWLEKPAALFCVSDVTAEFCLRTSLEKEACTDCLTGLYNRRPCRNRIQNCLDEKIPFSVCFIDLNRLKTVNDRFGHQEGDKYIMTVADLLKNTFRKGDFICRYGGDEFVAVLEYCTEEQARQKLFQIQEKLARDSEEKLYTMGISFGVAEIRDEMEQADRIISCADQKMYQMKAGIR